MRTHSTRKGKTALYGVLILILAIGAYGMYSSQGAAETGEEPIKIGANLPLTGPLSYKGEHNRKGIKLAVEEINREGGIDGRKLKVVYNDNQGRPKMAAKVAQKHTEVDKVDLMVSSFTAPSNAIAPVAERSETLLLYESTARHLATENDYVFRDYWDIKVAGAQLAKAASKRGSDSLAVVSLYGEHMTPMMKGIRDVADREEIEISTVQKFKKKAKDFRSILTKVKASGAEGVLVSGFSTHYIRLLRQMEELGMLEKDLFIMSPFHKDIMSDKELLDIFEATDAVANGPCFSTESTEASKRRFIEAYKERFGELPTPDSAYMYDDIHILAEAIREAGSTDSEDVARELKQIKDYRGVSGRVSFNEKGVGTRSYCVYENIHEGKTDLMDIPRRSVPGG